jgi:hypothetical protein
MAKENIGDKPWDNSEVKRDSILAVKSLVEQMNTFTDRAAFVTDLNKGNINLKKIIDYHCYSKKIINEPKDLILTKRNLPRGKIIDIE